MSDNRLSTSEPWIRRYDQRTIAILLSGGLIVSAIVWWLHGRPNGTLVELDKLPTQTVIFQVDINQADWPELIQLPEIGETLARRIVDFRQQRGPFGSIDELLAVAGIGPKTLEQIHPYLCQFQTIQIKQINRPGSMR